MSNWSMARAHHEGDTGEPYTTAPAWWYEPSVYEGWSYYRRQKSKTEGNEDE